MTDLRYDYTMTDAERQRGRALASEYGEGRPIVVVARHFVSCHSNAGDGSPANKCVANRHWHALSAWLDKRGFRALAVGSASIHCVPVRAGQRIHEVAIPMSDVDTQIVIDGASRVL